ncbi:MAG: mandelate racemase/muconate lactonizing enzyme family protein [Actinobacteria bacterium]|nr:mandelate racemase/muconate lactonizing enzyme family protein [Actinomycetota bacterium]
MEERIERCELTFLNLPMVQPETWAWGERDGYTVGLVRVHTSSGIVGLGEVVACMGPNDRVLRAIFDQMAEVFVGESALMPERTCAMVMSNGWYSFHRTAALVLAGLEMACWDAAGKHYGQPVSTLLGGALRTPFDSMYFVQGNPDLALMLERGSEAVARGFRTIYFKVGVDEERDVEVTLRMRERIGNGPKLRVDANEAWTPGTAVRILRRMAPAAVEYVEQPTLMHDIEGMAHVRAASGTPVGANQASWGKYAILEIVRRGAADVIMTDPHQEGGLMPLKKVLGLCEMAGLPFVNHAYNATSLTLTAHMQVMATSPSCFLGMQGHPDYLADDYVTPALDYRDGLMGISDRPGLGVELVEEKVEEFAGAFERDGMAFAYTKSRDRRIVTVPSQ